MENLSVNILILVAFNLLFFWQAWSNPFSLATSELLSTFFPSWIHQGRGEKNDPYYWIVPNAHPVLSTYYPFSSAISCIMALYGKGKLNDGFRAFLGLLLIHVLMCSVGYYFLIHLWANPIVAIFGAITLTYSSYQIKQQPCLIYTISWFPWLLYGIASHSILLSSVSFGMMLLAGYYPIGIQATLIAVCASVWWDSPLTWLPIGTLIGLPQLIPFLRYLPKTIRTNKHDNIGTIKLSHLITLISPSLNKPKDVGFWETSCYVGIIPLVLIASSSVIISQVWVLGVVSYLLAMGAFNRWFPRIPSRWLWTFQFTLGWLAVNTLSHLSLPGVCVWSLLAIQAFDLWYHNRLWPTKPYAELANRPSFAFNTQLTRFLEGCKERVSGLPWPLFTGHINRIKTLGYSGGMQLKLMAKWRHDTNPNGSGEHDYFRSNNDMEALNRYRVKYIVSRQGMGWKSTPIRNLWSNPSL